MKVTISTKWKVVPFTRKYFYHFDTFRPTNLKTFQFCKYNKKNEERKMKKQFHCTLFETYKYFHYLSFRDIKIFKEQKKEKFFTSYCEPNNLIKKKERKINRQFFYQTRHTEILNIFYRIFYVLNLSKWKNIQWAYDNGQFTQNEMQSIPKAISIKPHKSFSCTRRPKAN